MITRIDGKPNSWILALALAVFLFPDFSNAQRMRAASYGGGAGAARPAASRPVSSQSSIRPPGTQQVKPASSSSRPASTTRPSNSSSRPTINGGANSVVNKQSGTSKVGTMGGNKASTNNNNLNSNSDRINGVNSKDRSGTSNSNNNLNSPGTNSGNRPSNNNSNRPANNGGNRPGNNINIDNSTNITINNNFRPGGNLGYRPPYRPYPRPPYYWGGYGFSYFRPYYYHPFTPYYWGPMWHPFGFFVATIAVTAMIVSVDNQEYHYDSGVFYVQQNGGYVVIEAPQGARVKVIPDDSDEIEVSPTVINYYYGGTFYEKTDGGYTVVAPSAGAVVDKLPEGSEEVKIGEQTYVRFGETYYLPVQVDGKNMYEIVQVEKEQEQ